MQEVQEERELEEQQEEAEEQQEQHPPASLSPDAPSLAVPPVFAAPV